RATEAASLFEVRLREATVGAFQVGGGLFHLLRGTKAEQEVGEGETGRVIDAFLLGAFFTEIDLLHFLHDNLGQVDFGFSFFADATQHSAGVLIVYRPGYWPSQDRTKLRSSKLQVNSQNSLTVAALSEKILQSRECEGAVRMSRL